MRWCLWGALRGPAKRRWASLWSDMAGHEWCQWSCSGEDSTWEEIVIKTQGTTEEVAQEKQRAMQSVPVRRCPQMEKQEEGQGWRDQNRDWRAGEGPERQGEGEGYQVKWAQGEGQGHRLPNQPPAASPTREHLQLITSTSLSWFCEPTGGLVMAGFSWDTLTSSCHVACLPWLLHGRLVVFRAPGREGKWQHPEPSVYSQFHHILLVKTDQEASPDAKGWERGMGYSIAMQEVWIHMGGACGPVFQLAAWNMPCKAPLRAADWNWAGPPADVPVAGGLQAGAEQGKHGPNCYRHPWKA